MEGPISSSEKERLQALCALEVLDTGSEPEFDALTAVAARLFDVPVCLVSLVDADRQWFKSAHGTELSETPRNIAFCAYAIEDDAILEIIDPEHDPRFCDNPLVTGPPFIRYYAGAPLILASGHRIGTLCLIDVKPRAPLDAEQQRLLRELARLVVLQLESRKLRLREMHALALAAAMPDAIVGVGLDGLITDWNAAAERMFGYEAAEAVGASLEIIIPAHILPAYRANMARLIETRRSKLAGRTMEMEVVRRDGSLFPTEVSLAAWTDEAGRVTGIGTVIRDISARRALEGEKARAQRFADTVIDHLPAMLFVKHAETRRYLLWNGFAERATGLGRDEVLGRTDAELFGKAGEDYMERDNQILRSGLPASHEGPHRRPDGSERIFRTIRAVFSGGEEGARYLLGISEDVTDWRRAQDRAAFLAGHDPLTHLANRAALLQGVGSAIASGRPAALLAIDLDRFKAINDSHGPEIGDRVLIRAAKLIRGAVKRGDLVARIGGDEFAVMVEGPDPEVRAGALAERLAAQLAEPMELAGLCVAVSACIGMAIAPHHGRDVDELLRSALTALRRSRSEGPGRAHFFDASMDEAARLRQRIEARLAGAVERDEIEVHFQPVACLASGRVVGFEALARWTDAELGPVAPDRFIPVAEESGLIVALGENLLRRAAAEAAGWDPPLTLAVNLSPRQMEAPDAACRLLAIAREAGLPPSRLEFEITEGILIDDAAAALGLLNELKAAGVAITMDDFGTGYSSLSYFRSFPFDKVKIDQGFVRDMETSAEARAIVRAVIGLARGFGMEIVAEGVETQAQLDMLQAEGCTLLQGYLIGRPAPAAAFEGAVFGRRGGKVSAAA